jgi:ADP-ribosylglycohydrolase
MNQELAESPDLYEVRLQPALLSLCGLSVGDGFGECFFASEEVTRRRFELRQAPPPPWFWTDDTAMAISVVRALRECDGIDPDTLAGHFADSYQRDPQRGYGGMARAILRRMAEDVPWQKAAGEAFDGMGSFGNGGAMRAGPIGAWFAGSHADAAKHAARSAEVTHAHPEGQAGAVAVAVAAAWAAQAGELSRGEEMLETVIQWTPEGMTRTGLNRALKLGLHVEPPHMAGTVGCGYRVSAQDTVPFAVWCAARSFRNYPEAIWQTASALGDVDTTCAIVGSIVALSAAAGQGIPAEWLEAREPLPADLN